MDNKGTTWAKTPRATVNSLWYEQQVTIPAEWQGQRVVLDFRRIEGDALVFLNGQRVAELLRPGGEVDISAQVAWGKANQVRVFITRDYTGISRGFKDDPLRFLSRSDLPMPQWPMGITAPVTLIMRPRPVAITDVFAIPSWRNKTLTLEVELDADAPVQDYVLSGTVLDAEGKPALTLRGTPVTLPAGRSVQRISAKWANPTTWELDRGYVYTAKVALAHGAELADAAPAISFGFREIWTEGRELMMNGHPSHWRLVMILGLNPFSVDFHRLIGYNVVQIQPNPTAWWRNWAETPVQDEAVLATMDARGFGATVTAPAWNFLRAALLNDPHVRADYDREMALYLKRYRNHPSILAWTIGMNSYNPRENIHAGTLGRRLQEPLPAQAQQIAAACAFVKRYDPTRLAFSHADGSVGDISSANVYLNFVPLQEREEWPMAWAKDGNMPYSAVEFGQPFTANFWKGKRFLLTEYLAMYFGDSAYKDEAEPSLRKTVEYGADNKDGYGAIESVPLADYPDYWKFQRLFVRNTNRAWRSWGVNAGWLYWVLDTGYGDPPGFKGSIFGRYNFLKESVTAKPTWVNPNFEIHQQANLPLLVYLAGAPRHTDKTHAYASGETIKKQIAAIWDGAGRRALRAEWALCDAAGKAIKRETVPLTLDTGRLVFAPITITAPKVAARTPLRLTLTVTEGASVVATDEFPLQVFPVFTPEKNTAKIAVYDPQGKSLPWLRTLGVTPVAWKPGDALTGVDLLIIGREALTPGQAMPYSAQAVANGLQVLILEQKPEVWKGGFGFRTVESMPRYVFLRDTTNPMLAGLQPEDLINWRGTPGLLAEGVNAPSDVRHAPKWTNTHALASSCLAIPQVAGFTPLLAAEFDLAYSPLLEWRNGRGRIIFSTLDFTGRVGVDPVATRLAANLVRHAAQRPASTRRVCYAGGPLGRALLDRLQVAVEPQLALTNPAGTLLICGEGDTGIAPDALQAFLSAGGRTLALPQPAEMLTQAGFITATKNVVRVAEASHPFFRALGANTWRWRDALDVTAFAATGQPAGTTVLADGLAAVRTVGKGAQVYLQVGPELLETRYLKPEDSAKREGIQLSIARLYQLQAQLLTNLGATPSAREAARLAVLDMGPAFETLGSWNVLGPFRVAKDDGDAMLDTKFPGEDSAMAGDDNPNIIFTRDDGVRLDWRKTVEADNRGFIDLGKKLQVSELAVAYVMRRITCNTAHDAVLRFGADWRAMIWVNGTPVFRTLNGGNNPLAYRVAIPLRKGENTIAMKIASGSKGFGFFASLSKPPAPGLAITPELKGVSYYLLDDGFDPYQYFYW
jgi:beta-galactosidase